MIRDEVGFILASAKQFIGFSSPKDAEAIELRYVLSFAKDISSALIEWKLIHFVCISVFFS